MLAARAPATEEKHRHTPLSKYAWALTMHHDRMLQIRSASMIASAARSAHPGYDPSGHSDAAHKAWISLLSTVPYLAGAATPEAAERAYAEQLAREYEEWKSREAPGSS